MHARPHLKYVPLRPHETVDRTRGTRNAATVSGCSHKILKACLLAVVAPSSSNSVSIMPGHDSSSGGSSDSMSRAFIGPGQLCMCTQTWHHPCWALHIGSSSQGSAAVGASAWLVVPIHCQDGMVPVCCLFGYILVVCVSASCNKHVVKQTTNNHQPSCQWTGPTKHWNLQICAYL